MATAGFTLGRALQGEEKRTRSEGRLHGGLVGQVLAAHGGFY